MLLAYPSRSDAMLLAYPDRAHGTALAVARMQLGPAVLTQSALAVGWPDLARDCVSYLRGLEKAAQEARKEQQRDAERETCLSTHPAPTPLETAPDPSPPAGEQRVLEEA